MFLRRVSPGALSTRPGEGRDPGKAEKPSPGRGAAPRLPRPRGHLPARSARPSLTCLGRVPLHFHPVEGLRGAGSGTRLGGARGVFVLARSGRQAAVEAGQEAGLLLPVKVLRVVPGRRPAVALRDRAEVRPRAGRVPGRRQVPGIGLLRAEVERGRPVAGAAGRGRVPGGRGSAREGHGAAGRGGGEAGALLRQLGGRGRAPPRAEAAVSVKSVSGGAT